jgi:rubrerythrin
MEGGMHVGEALKRARGKDLLEMLEYAIALEANSYDLYIKMERSMPGKDSKKIFNSLLSEEKIHLDRLTALLDEKL